MLSKVSGDEGTGPEIDSTLGEAIKKVLQSELSKDKLKWHLEKYKIASNCFYLKVPMMDSEYYRHMSKPSKAHVVKLQQHQENIVKALLLVLSPIKNCLHKLLQNLNKKPLTL